MVPFRFLCGLLSKWAAQSAAMGFPKRKLDKQRWQQGRKPQAGSTRTAWDEQAAWYEQRHGDEGDDFHREVILPAVVRALGTPDEGQTVLDLGCGTGVSSRFLVDAGWRVHGIDASEAQLEHARKRASMLESYQAADLTARPQLPEGLAADHAVAVLSLQDCDPLDAVLQFTAAVIPPGGSLTIILTHPCFRVPKHATWGWDEERQLQYRRVDAYLTPKSLPIRTHPGRGGQSAISHSFHRPLQAYLNALGAAGWGVTGSEELCSHRRGTQGVRAAAEDRACREIPVFLLLQAQRFAH
jgi:SAM-dependent methyltransferase